MFMGQAGVKWAWIALIAILLVIIGYFILVRLTFSGVFDKHYTRDEAMQNFDQREKAIYDLADYFRKHKPADHEVFFEPGRKRYSLSIGLPGWAIMEKYPNKAGTRIKLGSAKMDELLTTLGWTRETVTTLKEKLKKADCLSITSHEEVVDIEYRTGTWSGFSYMIYDKPISDSMLQVYKEAGVTILRNNVKLAFSSAL